MCKRIKKWLSKSSTGIQLYWIPNIRNFSALLTMLFSVISVWLDPPCLSSWTAFWSSATWIHEITVVLGFLCAILSLLIWFIDRTTRYQFERTKKKEELSAATLKALRAVDETKTREVLRITYGRVPDWQPRNYIKNVLTYDVHEHIRTILYALRDLILDMTEGLNKEQVLVDFVYCYPDECSYNGELPIPSFWLNGDNEKPWRLITSGNHSLSGSIQGYLAAINAFYRYIDVNGYCFFNDKSETPIGNYQFSAKDGVWKARSGEIGSIIGLVIELKNDEPEATFVKGILTINTFGKPLFNKKKEGIKLKDFDEIFFEKIVLSFKQLILGELAQMFIRHSIRDGEMCPLTGKMRRTKKNSGTQQTDKNGGGQQENAEENCLLTANPCRFTDQTCPYRKPQKTQQS